MLKLKFHCRSPDIEDPNDRVEVAFRRLDSDGDGYLHLEDFVQLGWPLVRAEVGQDQLQRIFRGCDQTGDGRVSLQVTAAPGSCLLCPHVAVYQEFRELAQSNGDLTMEGMFD